MSRRDPDLPDPATPASSPPAPRFRWRRWVIGLTFFLCAAVLSIPVWAPACVTSFARSAIKQRHPERALRWLDQAQVILPNTATTQLLRARAERHRGRMDRVEAALREAQRLGADSRAVHLENCLAMAQSGQLTQVLRFLPEFLTNAGDDLPEVCEAYVIGYLRAHRYAEAQPLLTAWIADWPADPRPLLLRSRVHMLEQQTKAATDDLSRAHRLVPADSEITCELAHVLRQRNDWNGAATLYRECLRDPRRAASAQLGLGLCCKALGDNDQAAAFLRQAADAPSPETEALREYGRWLQENGDYVAAATYLSRALERTTWDDELHYLLAQALRAQGQDDAAKPHFDYVTKARTAFRELRNIQDRLHKDPGNLDLLTRSGEILLTYSDPEEGVVRLMAVLDRDPGNQAARKLLVDHYDRRARSNPDFHRLAEEHRRWLTSPASSSGTP